MLIKDLAFYSFEHHILILTTDVKERKKNCPYKRMKEESSSSNEVRNTDCGVISVWSKTLELKTILVKSKEAWLVLISVT